ncbi:hypothetical protein [Pseudooceanicola sp.]|uniref:hypothetical protein n=1 Tax=Pseudooceanicola sp. TaxID=1914328 RepID=UPI00261A987E|nr:hypothetical protein [Pseudooceanicola sp.]MDF1855939.1 hypothetical protein [Pseudooceanicola sp.]
MEFILVFGIILITAGGLGLGLMLTGRPPSDSCGAAACAGHCDICPRRREAQRHG